MKGGRCVNSGGGGWGWEEIGDMEGRERRDGGKG